MFEVMLPRVPSLTRLPRSHPPPFLPALCDRALSVSWRGNFLAQLVNSSDSHTEDEPLRLLSHVEYTSVPSSTSTQTPASALPMAIETPVLSRGTGPFSAPTLTPTSTSTSVSASSLLTLATPLSVSTLASSSVEATTQIPSTRVETSTSASRTSLPIATTPPVSSSSSTIRSTTPLSTSPSSSSNNKDALYIDSSFLNCCEPGEKLKVGVLLSGGVDSSVALRLLLAAGHFCTAFYLKIWFQEDYENFWSSCPWEEDLMFAQAVCDEAGVELQVIQLTDEYWKNVVSYMIAEYHAGRTPNPDILCNSRIKFGVFLEHVKNMGFDRIASGHYAKVLRNRGGPEGVQAVLQLSKDEVKDQTYFLSHLSQLQLSQLMFPLGCISKAEVRQIADILGLPNKKRKDSQGICFLGKVKFSDFICRHLGEREGRILEAETGTHLGSHKGFWFYTIGQRQGLRLSDGPWYVVDKDREQNVVFVSKKYYSVEKKRRTFEVHNFNWFGGQPMEDLSGLRCKVRHGPRFYNCSLSFHKSTAMEERGTIYSSALVQLSEDDQGLAAGQYAAFYKGDLCLGSGVISEFKVDGCSAVSTEAREAAKMKELPAINQRKPTKKKMSTAVRKADMDVVGKGDTSTPEEISGWLLPRLQRYVKKFLSWIQLR